MRASATSHHATFRQAFLRWRWPGRGQEKGSGIEVAVALERWLAQYPENAETVQQLALGAALNAVAVEEWAGGERIAGIGLSATLLGALESQERLASTVLLALLASRSDLELGDTVAARLGITRALEPLERVDAYAPLASYLQLQRHLLTGELAESSLEISSAADGYERAVDIVSAISANRRRAREMEDAWVRLIFGQTPSGQEEASHSLWVSEMRTARRRALLGLARTSPSEQFSRDAIRLCLDEGLPVEDTALALQGVVSKIPHGELDGIVDGLVAAVERLGDRHQDTWFTALRALQAEAHLARGDSAVARRALESVSAENLRGADAISIGLAFAARVHVETASTQSAGESDQVGTLLSVHAATTDRLAQTSLQLRFRAAVEPALMEAVRAQIEALQDNPSATTRREASVLLDALRAPETIPIRLNARSGSNVERAVRNAADRIGRLAAALASRDETADTLVLIIQSVGEATAFICVGGDAKTPTAVALPGAKAYEALRTLSQAAERAIHEGTPALEMEAVGRRTFDALPSMVRARILRARTVIVVPDFASGQDRVSIELLHDGASFLGFGKVVARCLSLSHALRALEAPLVSPLVGRRALCASVADPPGLPALRFAHEEVVTVSRALQAALWSPTAVHNSDADAETILELAPLANVLHIACHGDASAGAEALVLADGARLTAADIATRHRLRGFVYLNACSLAQGRYLGGGVSRGVAYAFIKAGAACVIANLLAVEDQGAALLSEQFYGAARECHVGEAMRRAREQLRGRVNVALLAASVVIGDPFVQLSGDVDSRPDATSRLFRNTPVPARLPPARGKHRAGERDPRFAAAVNFARAMRNADDGEIKRLAQVARDIGHMVGEAHCWLTLAERQRASSDRAALAETLRRAVGTLEPLRGVWKPAFDAHRKSTAGLRALDPAYIPRTLTTVRTKEGLSINDRSDPAVDAILRLFEAQHEHEAHWRGEPVLRIPDRDVASVAHNAVVWGYLNRVYGTGAEVGVASAFAARAAWRGLIREDCMPHLMRIFAGLLAFLWGQQKVQHLEHWMASAHRNVIALAIERVARRRTPPGDSLPERAARDVATALDGTFSAQGSGSKFAQARAALRATDSVAPRLASLGAQIEGSIERLHAADPYAAADFAAWVLGELLNRAGAATSGATPRHDVALACTSLYEELATKQEGWFMPYLMDGFKQIRQSGGQDLFAQWSAAVL